MDDIDWTFEGTWPHPPRWFATPDGRMHFVDVGPRDGRPVVLVHGNPSWGYLFRHFIPPLAAAGHRVIVPDHLGFGRSDKPSGAGLYRVERHAARLALLLDSLDLRDVTVVPHDWGGPIALAWAVKRPERVSRLALLDTFVHKPSAAVSLPLPLRLFRTPGAGELLVKGLHAIVRGFLLGGGVRRPDRLTPTVRRAYLTPHRTWGARTAILAFAREFPAGPDGRVAQFQGEVHR
jgi:haloalkane dehalogenase